MKRIIAVLAVLLFVGFSQQDSTQKVEKAKADTVQVRAREHVVIDSLRSKLTLWEDAWENTDAVVAAMILILGVGIGMMIKSKSKL